MNSVIASHYLLVGIYSYAFIFYFSAAIQKPVDKKILTFALSMFSGAILSISNIYVFQAKNIIEVIFPLKLSIAAALLAYIAIFWFLALHTKKIPKQIPLWFSGFFTLILIVNFIQPYSLLYANLEGIHVIEFLGGTITGLVGKNSGLFVLTGILIIISLIYQQYVLFQHYASTRKRSDLFLALAFSLLILCSLHGLLARLAIIPAVPLGIYGLALLNLTWSLILSLENRHQLILKDFIYEFSGEAVMLTDNNNKIISVNPAFTKTTGYTLEEVLGKHPNILSAKIHDRSFYDDMWKSLNTSDSWQGEIWNLRKNGEIYPEWLKINVVRDSNHKIINHIASFTDITENKKKQETIENLLSYDGLTGLPNRQLMLKRLSDAFELSSKRKQRGAILFIDLDNVKSINEALGRHVGDLLIVEMSNRIERCLGYGDSVARISGDIFGVILNRLSFDKDTAVLQAKNVAIRIKNIINEPFNSQGESYYFDACIGISVFINHEITIEELLKQVDAAMYQAKKKGKGRIQFFDPLIQSSSEERFKLEALLRAAVPEQLDIFYQSQVDIHGKILGAEALIRWRHPQNGLVSPANFIPLAEESGLIIAIGDWVLKTACIKLKSWENDPDTSDLSLSVNVSAKQFYHANFIEKISVLLKETDINPARLKLELTESILVEDLESTIQKMVQLKAMGISLSLDDFGTGFSSLSYLKRMPLDQLKIDQSFVNDIEIDPNETVIVKTVIALGQTLGLTVIAEGVETENQRLKLAELGCTEFQGYLFSKPVSINDFEVLVKS